MRLIAKSPVVRHADKTQEQNNTKHMENKLRLLRLKNNLTQENVAFELGISQKAYSKLENGLVRLTQDKVIKLSKIFNVPTNELCNFCDKSLNNSKLALLLDYLESKEIPIPNNLK